MIGNGGLDAKRGSFAAPLMARICAAVGLLSFGVITVGAIWGLPNLLEPFALLEITIYVILSILALSLAFIWGYGGILCFGQAAFFGVGAYAYAIAVINLGECTVPLLLSIVIPTLLAAFLGYFMFYGRIGDVYAGAITLTVSLILLSLANSTAGDQYRIGAAQLGGFNGIPSIPTLNLPGHRGEFLDPVQLFQFCVFCLAAVYYGLRALLFSHFGHVVVAIRENERRAEFLGYDSRLYKLGAFAIGGGIAGLSGALFANWGAFISPTVFSLAQSAKVIIWVIVGGLGTLTGPILGCFFIEWLDTWLGESAFIDTNLALGIILVIFVLLMPKGLLPAANALFRRVILLVEKRRA
jgi:branched-chain amino acid transport system permease protein